MPDRPTALLCTSNGVGLGHLTRMMAIGQALTVSEPVIFTLSGAVSIPVSLGFRTEYLPSVDPSGLPPHTWNRLLARRLEHLIDLYQPSVIVYDGTHPYSGMCRVLSRHPGLRSVWQRRGMWKPGKGYEALERASYFSDVVEPGDYASSYDRGLTADATASALRLNPFRFEGSAFTRESARAAIGLDPDRPAVLVQLGAGRINDISSTVGQVVRASLDRHIQVVIAASALSKKIDPIPDVTTVHRYPISELFPAFDFAVMAGGYNSVHEALSLSLPTIFVPNLRTKLDDQAARTSWVHDSGCGLEWRPDRVDADHCVEQMFSEVARGEMREQMRKLDEADGAREMARILDAS